MTEVLLDDDTDDVKKPYADGHRAEKSEYEPNVRLAVSEAPCAVEPVARHGCDKDGDAQKYKEKVADGMSLLKFKVRSGAEERAGVFRRQPA